MTARLILPGIGGYVVRRRGQHSVPLEESLAGWVGPVSERRKVHRMRLLPEQLPIDRARRATACYWVCHLRPSADIVSNMSQNNKTPDLAPSQPISLARA